MGKLGIIALIFAVVLIIVGKVLTHLAILSKLAAVFICLGAIFLFILIITWLITTM